MRKSTSFTPMGVIIGSVWSVATNGMKMMTRCICGAAIIPLMLDCVRCGESYSISLIIREDLKPEDITLEEDECTLTVNINYGGVNYRRVIERRISVESFAEYVIRIVGRINED